MAWVKLDDQFPDHPKVVSAGPAAAWLFVCGLAYAARQLTDGFIPAGAVPRLAALPNIAKAAKQLVAAGLWETCDGGYRIHDYLDYNPSRADVMTQREATKKRVSRWRKGGGATLEERDSNVVTNGAGNAVTTPLVARNVTALPSARVSRPVPGPSPSPECSKAAGSGEAPRDGDEAACSPPAEGKRRDDAAFVAATLKTHPSWREPLRQRIEQRKPHDPDAYAATVLRGWLSGDGTPGKSAKEERADERERARSVRIVRVPEVAGENPGTTDIVTSPKSGLATSDGKDVVCIALPPEANRRCEVDPERIERELERLESCPEEKAAIAAEIAAEMPPPLRRPGHVLFEHAVDSQIRQRIIERMRAEMDGASVALNGATLETAERVV